MLGGEGGRRRLIDLAALGAAVDLVADEDRDDDERELGGKSERAPTARP